jgi:hypothetical protein
MVATGKARAPGERSSSSVKMLHRRLAKRSGRLRSAYGDTLLAPRLAQTAAFSSRVRLRAPFRWDVAQMNAERTNQGQGLSAGEGRPALRLEKCVVE